MSISWKCRLPDVSVFVTFLVAVFGMSTFLHVDAIWTEIPVLVQTLPENWELPAYITLAINVVCNIPPLIYFVVNTFKPKSGGGGEHGVKMILVLFILSILTTVLLIFLWDVVNVVNGKPHSVAFLGLVVMAGTVNFMSMMVFVGYMVNLPAEYIPAFHTGEGLAGFIFSILGLVQGSGMYECVERSIPYNSSQDIGTNMSFTVDIHQERSNYTMEAVYLKPNYSVSVHFVILLVVALMCFTSFLLLQYLPYCRRYHVKSNKELTLKMPSGDNTDVQRADDESAIPLQQLGNGDATDNDVKEDSLSTKRKNNDSDREQSRTTISNKIYVWLLLTTVWDSAVKYGIMDAVIAYSSLPYGVLTLNLATRLSLLILPIASFSSYFLPTQSVTVINIHSFIGLVSSIYVIALSVMSPNLPLMSSLPEVGSTLIIIAWLLVAATFGYKRAVISSLLREKGERALVWFAICCLTGSFFTNIPMFVCISVLGLFEEVSPCG